MHVLAIINQKGGVGKTNVVGNLGAALGARERRVVLIDADPQHTLTDWVLQEKPSELRGTAEVLSGEVESPATLLVDAPAFDSRLLPADFDRLDRVQSDLQRQPTGLFSLATAIAELEETCDYVLIDCPPNYGVLTTSALYAATGVIVPIDCSKESIGGLALLLRTLHRVSKAVHKLPMHAIVATAYKNTNTFHPGVVDGVRSTFPEVPLYTIRDAIDVQRAVDAYRPIRRYDPRNGASADFDVLALAIDEALSLEKALA
jgi:chromosome partitioning protein